LNRFITKQSPSPIINNLQSNLLSIQQKKYINDGNTLIQDSIISEGVLTSAMKNIYQYAVDKFDKIGVPVIHRSTITLDECQQRYFTTEEYENISNNKNKKVYIKPDGGILEIILSNGQYIPILITEHKCQGTNDIRFQKGLSRQATGNACERSAKNIRAVEMLCADEPIFPYAIFAEGCDFHHSETISSRFTIMNYGNEPHYIEVSPSTTTTDIPLSITRIIPSINIKKKIRKHNYYSIASIFIKAHKWDEMPHNSSRWEKDEIINICKYIIDQAFENYNHNQS